MEDKLTLFLQLPVPLFGAALFERPMDPELMVLSLFA